MSNTQAYSIYADSRPMRVAYLVENSDKCLPVIDEIMKRNQGCWGGRFSPIFLINGNIDEKQLEFLKIYDPDVVKYIGDIKQNTLQKITFSTTPYHFSGESIDKEYIRTEPENERLEFLPSASFISKVTKYEINGSQLILFDIKDVRDEDIKMFIIRNFGILDIAYIQRKSLEDVNKMVIKLSDEKSLIASLEILRKARSIVFPIQLSSSHCPLSEIERQKYEEAFDICIGDGLLDIIYCWNRLLGVPYWKRSHINSLWLPEKLAGNDEFMKSFDLFLQRYSNSYNSSGYNSVRIVSHSLKKSKLNKFLEKISTGCFHTKKIINLENKQSFSDYVKFFSFDRLKNGMQYFRFNSDEENLNILPPLGFDTVRNAGSWMVDLYVNRGNQGLYYSNLETWLQLPAKNILARSVVPIGPSRITLNGLPCCVARMPFSEPIAENGNVIKFRMIYEEELFRTLMLSNSIIFKDFSYYNDDERKRIKAKEYINDTYISSSGKYLLGFVGNFEGLNNAHIFLSQKYWTTVFNFLSGKDVEKDKNLLEAIRNKIKKDIKRGNVSSQNAEDLAYYLLDLAKKYDLPSYKGASYEIFTKNLEKKDKRIGDPSISKYKKNKIIIEAKNELRDEMNDLIQLGILLMGLYIKCPSCGFAEWRTLKDISQEVSCRGCNANFFLESEQRWSYRLNSLIQAGVANYNLVPVVLSLAKLSQRARHFFSFFPSMDVFGSKKSLPFTDVDLVCIVDGKLILGECKLSSDDFKKKDFDNMEIVGKALRPNELVFSTPSGTMTSIIKEELKRLEDKLSPLGVKVKWMGEDYVPHLDRY